VDSLPLHPYDLLMLVLLIGYMLFGLLKGAAWQVASLASLTLSSVVALHFSPTIAPWFSNQAPWNRFLAMFVLFLGTSLVIWLLFRLVRGAIDRVRLKECDRQAGALFGLLKGFVLCLVITFFAVTLSESTRQTILKTRSGYYAAVLIRNATPVLPTEVREALGEYIDEFEKKLNPATPAEEGKSPTREATEKATKPVIQELAKPILEQLNRTGAGGQQPNK